MATRRPVSCSIIINNCNYAAYVGAAIDSALNQTYPHVEVIVVDDGSSDESRAVIAGFGDRVRSVFKANGGQASAINAGWEMSSGDIAIFLDADDMLFEETVERVVAAWRPDVAAVHYPLRWVHADGSPINGMVWPPMALRSGDMIPILQRFGLYVAPATSGNAFGRAVLQKIMPIPEDIYRAETDGYLIPMAALRGPVAALRDPGGVYRIHGTNQSRIDLDRLVTKIRRQIATTKLLHQRQPDPPVLTEPVPAHWPQHLKFRIVANLLKKYRLPELEALDEIKGDRRWQLSWRMAVSCWTWPSYPLKNKLGVLFWLVMINILPVEVIMRVPPLARAGHMDELFESVRQRLPS
jgi:glycosyltransferase involved in cell wall biosynthesis